VFQNLNLDSKIIEVSKKEEPEIPKNSKSITVRGYDETIQLIESIANHLPELSHPK
jgi:hypothetical protein